MSERIRRGLVKPGSIYARFAELTPFASPKEEQIAVWKVRVECGPAQPGTVCSAGLSSRAQCLCVCLWKCGKGVQQGCAAVLQVEEAGGSLGLARGSVGAGRTA